MVWCVSPARARARLAQRSPAPAQASASADPAHQHRRSPTQPAQPSAARQRRLTQRSARPAQRSLAPAPAQSSASAGPVQDSQRSPAHSAAHPQHSCWAGSTLTSGRGGGRGTKRDGKMADHNRHIKASMVFIVEIRKKI